MTSEDRNRVPHADDEDPAQTTFEMLPAYALGALDEEDYLRVERELARSGWLREEYRRLQLTIDRLDITAPRAQPPATLRDSVLAMADGSSRPVPIAHRRSSLWKAVAAAAAILVLALGAVIAVLVDQVSDRDDRISELEAAAASRPSTDFTLPLVWTEIGTAGTDSPGWGYFCRTEDGSVGWIIVEGMHAANDQVFQMWLVNGDQFVSAGMFATDDQGRGFGVVRADAPVHSFSQIWITIEPAGGSPSPTSDPDVSVPIV